MSMKMLTMNMIGNFHQSLYQLFGGQITLSIRTSVICSNISLGFLLTIIIVEILLKSLEAEWNSGKRGYASGCLPNCGPFARVE